jgi:EAL domain-containing protein (putative c-di-GMP-specific phosphodiesterase class I)
MLKVAKSFVDGLGRGGRDASFVRMIIDLARTLGMSVIAEGIETADQAKALAALRCEYGQGFHLGRPSPARQPAELTAAA